MLQNSNCLFKKRHFSQDEASLATTCTFRFISLRLKQKISDMVNISRENGPKDTVYEGGKILNQLKWDWLNRNHGNTKFSMQFDDTSQG